MERPKYNPAINFAELYGIARANAESILGHANALEAYCDELEKLKSWPIIVAELETLKAEKKG